MLDIFFFNPCPHFDPKREKNKDDVKLLKDHEPAVLIVFYCSFCFFCWSAMRRFFGWSSCLVIRNPCKYYCCSCATFCIYLLLDGEIGCIEHLPSLLFFFQICLTALWIPVFFFFFPSWGDINDTFRAKVLETLNHLIHIVSHCLGKGEHGTR